MLGGGQVQAECMASGYEEWVYDWNRREPEGDERVPRTVELNDETLRDGLQSPSARTPPLQAKLDFLHILAGLGISGVDIGLPASSPQVMEDTIFLAREIARSKLPLKPNCAARTVRGDIRHVKEVSERAGLPIEVSAFIGSSAARSLAEGWDIEFLLKATRESVSEAVRLGLSIMYVTEDTTRTHPDVLRQLYTAAIECGARRICIADTVGFATPAAARRIVRFLKDIVKESGEDVAIDWHGHMDRGLGLMATLAAFEAGADRLHGSAVGLGERIGNAPLDLIMVNLKLMGCWERDISDLTEYVNWIQRWTGVSLPWNYPVFGSDAFRTGTGVHASAIMKAMKMGDPDLVDMVYSAVPASWFGLRQTIEVGPMSGDANVAYWLAEHGLEVTSERMAAIRNLAKESDGMLTDDEILDALQRLEGT